MPFQIFLEIHSSSLLQMTEHRNFKLDTSHLHFVSRFDVYDKRAYSHHPIVTNALIVITFNTLDPRLPFPDLIVITFNTLDPRLPFPDSVGGIFPGPATTQKVYLGIEWFSQLAGLQWLTVLSMLIIGG